MSAIDRESICEKYLKLTENFWVDEAKWLDDDDDQNLTNAKEVGEVDGEVDGFRKELKKLFVEQFGNCIGMGSSSKTYLESKRLESKRLLQDSNM